MKWGLSANADGAASAIAAKAPMSKNRNRRM
jgi:hypothetical protein